MEVKVPAVEVKAGGQDIVQQLSGELEQVRVNLDMDGESSAAVTIGGVYHLGESKLDDQVQTLLAPGSPVEVRMGYEGSKSTVICGYLEQVSLEADQEHPYLLTLQIYDVVKLLKENSSVRILTEKKHSDVFASVMDAYGWTGTKVSSDSTKAFDNPKSWYQGESDYDFIMRELVEACSEDLEFYVSAGTAYYKKVAGESPVLDIRVSSGVYRIQGTSAYLKKNITVYGSSAVYAAFTGKAQAEAVWQSGGAGEEALVKPDAGTQDLADQIALSRANRLKRQSRQVEISMEGNPSLLPGAYVTVSEFETVWDGTYRIRKAKHLYDEDGYRTEITLEGV